MKHRIEDAVFYITNVCNLACAGCESFNNYNFKGHFNWNTHSKFYEEWAKRIDIDSINIHGGEPLLNRDILNWAINLKRLWPEAERYISSNGTQFKHNTELVRELINIGWAIDSVVHDPSTFDQIKAELEAVLSVYNYTTVEIHHPKWRLEYHVDNQWIASLEKTYHFKDSAIREIVDGTVYLQRSNIKQAYKVCNEDAAGVPCVPFIRGLMYSCTLTSLIPDFVTQFNVEQEAKDLMLKYRAATPYDTDEQLRKHIADIYRPRKMCKFCPDNSKTHPIFPMPRTKPKIP